MSSRQLRKIARQNGAKAAGTKTPEGIQKSSLNAQRHGLTGKALVLTNESQAQYDALQDEYVARFQPADGVEMDLIDDMVTARWRLRRIWIMQTAAFDLKMDQMEQEIAEKFTSIDQPTRTVVAFSNMANNEKSLQLLLDLLCVFDGVNFVEDGPDKGNFEIWYSRGDTRHQLNAKYAEMLHDILRSYTDLI